MVSQLLLLRKVAMCSDMVLDNGGPSYLADMREVSAWKAVVTTLVSLYRLVMAS